MRTLKKLLNLFIIVLITLILFIGCDKIPEEYTEGVKLHRSYPAEYMPIYDDAVVYYCDNDEQSVTIKYGVDDELDDVADFYKDHFEDKGISLEDETDKSTKYIAEGICIDFSFKIKITEPTGSYEEQVFKTVVKVDINLVHDSLGTADQLKEESPLNNRILGFWRQESFQDNQGNKQKTYLYGSAYHFLPDGTVLIYLAYALVETGQWKAVDEKTLLFTPTDKESVNVTITTEKRNSEDYLLWEDASGVLTFFKDSPDGFSNQSSYTQENEAVTPDEQLSKALDDTTWYFINEQDESSNSINNNMICYSDGTFEDSYNGDTIYGTWYISAGNLFLEAGEDDKINFEIRIEYRGSANYLYVIDNEEGEYCLYSNFPQNSVITYTSDEDMTTAISGKKFNELYYMYSDGRTEPSQHQNHFTFNEDKTFIDFYKGEPSSGTWYFTDGYIKNFYDNGDILYYPAKVEYNKVSNNYYLFLGDLEEGYENCYWVFATSKP